MERIRIILSEREGHVCYWKTMLIPITLEIQRVLTANVFMRKSEITHGV